MKQTIRIEWVQKGHTTVDPCGHQNYRMRAVWAVADSEQEAVRELHEAERYCRKQDWVEWEVSRGEA